MSSHIAEPALTPGSDHPHAEKTASFGSSPEILAEIYKTNNHLAVWQRQLPVQLNDCVDHLFRTQPNIEIAMSVTPQKARFRLLNAMGSDVNTLHDDIAEIVDMFCCLFDLKNAGLRLAALERAMCPRFHVDRVPCRLVTTYNTVATQWLPHARVNRAQLGRGGDGLTDLEAGLYAHCNDVEQFNCGDVALLKGELWQGNEGAGLVHRSPDVPAGTSRLVLTLDIGEQNGSDGSGPVSALLD